MYYDTTSGEQKNTHLSIPYDTSTDMYVFSGKDYKSINDIIKDGVLQEGSPHYQLLLTKNLIETCLIAESLGSFAVTTPFLYTTILADAINTFGSKELK